MEVILLAGGFGTRLKSVVNDVPKCMSEVAGKPFLEHIFNYLERQFVDHVILSLGYKSEIVIEWLRSKAFTFKLSWVVENEPLGTGGAIKFAMGKAKENWVYVMNADTYFPIDLRGLKFPENIPHVATIITLKYLENLDRYGHVILDENNIITSFKEKQTQIAGFINAGTYLINKNIFSKIDFPKQFSFESDYLVPNANNGILLGQVFDCSFIDIGIPEDFMAAQNLSFT